MRRLGAMSSFLLQLDVADPSSIKRAAHEIEQQ